MINYQKGLYRFIWVVLAALVLIGCGAKGKPAEFKQTAGEMKEGPGVFTGKEGEFAVYDSKKGGPFWDHSKEQSGEAPEAGQTVTAAGATSEEPELSPETAREFQEFQEWKQEQKEFREYLEWKNSAKGSAEYREFLEWKEWKSYQEWKKQQGQ